MKEQEVFKKIGSILNELAEQYNYLDSASENLNDIELEFFVANAAYLAQNTEMLRKLHLQQKENKLLLEEPAHAELKPQVAAKDVKQPEAPKPNEKYFEPLVHQPEQVKEVILPPVDAPVPHIAIAADTPADDYSYKREEPEVIRHELEIDESWIDDEDEPGIVREPEQAEPIVAKEPEIPMPEPQAKKEKPVALPKVEPVAKVSETVVAKPTLPKPPETERLTINQKISAQMAGKNAHEPALSPITDIKAATTLNDKLLYVKDLFNGYSLAYAEAIDILNRLNSFEEAEQYLKTNYVAKNHWDSKPETAEKFYTLLKRRYSQF